MPNEWIMSKRILSKTYSIRLDGNYINTKTLVGSVDIMSPWIFSVDRFLVSPIHIVALVRPRASTLLHAGHEPSGSKVYFFLDSNIKI